MSRDWPIPPPNGGNFPALERVEFLGYSLPVHPLAVGPFRWVHSRLTGLYAPTGPDTGTFANRNINHTPPGPATWEAHSEHAHGHTLDLNWQANPARTGEIICDFTDAVLIAFLSPVPDLGKPAFRWGGTWGSDLEEALALLHRIRAGGGRVVDPGWNDSMHFELELTPAECRAVDWDALIATAEEDDVTPEQAALLESYRLYRLGYDKGYEDPKAWPAKDKPGYEDKLRGFRAGRTARIVEAAQQRAKKQGPQ